MLAANHEQMKHEEKGRPLWIAAFRNESGTPEHLLRAANTYGLSIGAVPLREFKAQWKLRQIAWNLKHMASGSFHNGYQYSESFLNWLWGAAASSLHNCVVINCFQLYPSQMMANRTIEKWFFIDQTLSQLFSCGGYNAELSDVLKFRAIEKEKLQYSNAAGIIAQSKWAAKSLVNDYKVPASKVHVGIPGANLPDAEYGIWEKTHQETAVEKVARLTRKEPRLIFVGKDWRRKGLEAALNSIHFARCLGLNPSLRIIGCDPRTIPSRLRTIEGVEWLGFVDKNSHPKDFMEAVSECDIGCLFSTAEAGGMALREYHALGLATVAANVGGIPEYVVPAASRLTNDATPENIACILHEICVSDPDIVRRAWSSRRSVLWAEAIKNFPRFLPSLHCLSNTPLEARSRKEEY
jgi:glycosyltransferase involved in cell wall biosynthesis